MGSGGRLFKRTKNKKKPKKTFLKIEGIPLGQSNTPLLLPTMASTNLTHTVNMGGRLGDFVDPSSCSCSTCLHFVEPAVDMAPLLPTNSLPLPGDDDEPIEAWGPGTGAAAAGEQTPPHGMTTLPPPPPLRRTNAFADALGRTQPTEEEEELDILSRLRALRSRLQLKQRNLYKDLDGADLAAADYEWSELEHKIRAIESLLSTFRFVFRTG